MPRMSIYRRWACAASINACGIYTDLGGSRASAARRGRRPWRRTRRGRRWTSCCARSGARIAALCGAEAARVVPGASAGIALAVGACIARGDGAAMEALPLRDAVVLMQRGHEYKYARCAALAGARVEWVDDIAARARTRARRRCCIPRTSTTPALPLDRARAARARRRRAGRGRRGLPVLPAAALERWATAGDVACFSAKYFWGPNGGGFVAGRAALVGGRRGARLHRATSPGRGGRSGARSSSTARRSPRPSRRWRSGSRPITTRGWRGLRGAGRARGAGCGACRAPVALEQFTLDERFVDGPVNAVVVPAAASLEPALAARRPEHPRDRRTAMRSSSAPRRCDRRSRRDWRSDVRALAKLNEGPGRLPLWTTRTFVR